MAVKDKGACTNQADSYFSRMRRAEFGAYHRVSGAYLYHYADEMTWREDMRRESNGDQYVMVAAAARAHPANRIWKGTGSSRSELSTRYSGYPQVSHKAGTDLVPQAARGHRFCVLEDVRPRIVLSLCTGSRHLVGGDGLTGSGWRPRSIWSYGPPNARQKRGGSLNL